MKKTLCCSKFLKVLLYSFICLPLSVRVSGITISYNADIIKVTDVIADSSINIIDTLLVARYYTGLEDSLPVSTPRSIPLP